MTKDLAILIPGIRPDNWLAVYNSMAKSFSGTWEMVFAGPWFPENMKGFDNVRYIETLACPIVARQMALLQCDAHWISHAADDCTFLPGAFDNTWKILESKGFDYKTLIAGKYLEDVNGIDKLDNPLMRGDEYYYLKFHGIMDRIAPLPNPETFLLLNTGVISRDLMIEVGGYDCSYEACAMACCDLSLRLQLHVGPAILQPDPIFTSTHLPGLVGDHGPINDGQLQHDEPYFYNTWSQPTKKEHLIVPLDLWQEAPQRWERRFGKA